jgi:putative flippase GtrA
MNPPPDAEPRRSPVRQFIRYAICGGLATGVDILVFYALAWRAIPALLVTDPMVRLLDLNVVAIDSSQQVRNYVICRTISFVFANLVAYGTNALWVFETGRHARRKEIALFYAVSLTSLALGTGLGAGMIRYGGASTTLAYAANVVASVLINYAGRKFWVFRG